MKLPEIDFGGPVQSIAPSIAAEDQARSGMIQTFQQGLGIMHEEMIKQQQQSATAHVASALSKAELDITSKKYYSTQEIKDLLGADYDSLTPEVKAQLTTKKVDPTTGETVDAERNDIPSWLVAGQIYDKASKQALDDASQMFTSQGHAVDFQNQMIPHIDAKKMEIGKHQLHDFYQWKQENETVTATQLANAGAVPQALQLIDSSRALDPEQKDKLRGVVEKIGQTKPLFDAIRSNDIVSIVKYRAQLENSENFTKLDPQEKLQFANRLDAEIKQFQDSIKHSQEDALKANGRAAWNVVLTKYQDWQAGRGPPPRLSDVPMPGSMDPDTNRAMMEWVQKVQKGEPIETNWQVYTKLSDMARSNKEQFGNIDLMTYRNKLSDSDFRHFTELQASSKGNSDAYDNFQNTDEYIDYQLREKYHINVKEAKDDDGVAKKVGYLKTAAQKALADAQKANNGKPLDLNTKYETIDNALSRQYQTAPGTVWGENTDFFAMKSGIPATASGAFLSAVQEVSPAMWKSNQKKAIESNWSDFQASDPHIVKAAGVVLLGQEPTTEQKIAVWARARRDHARYEGILRQAGKWSTNPEVNSYNIFFLSVKELSR